jgi:flagellar secretion chaperone FliS
MYDAPSVYRSAQVTTATPAGQVVLLYEGAIRFTLQFAARLDAGDLEGAHTACVRAQAILSALRESLDLSAGQVARDLDGIYDFALRRLVAANMAKQAQPALEVIGLLRPLLEAWRGIAVPVPTGPAASPARPATSPVAPLLPFGRSSVGLRA